MKFFHKHDWIERGRGKQKGLPLHPSEGVWYEVCEAYLECDCGKRTTQFHQARLKTWTEDKYLGEALVWVWRVAPKVMFDY